MTPPAQRLAAVLFVVTCSAAFAQVSTEPYFDATTRRPEYAGPGREDPAPEDPDEVRIGYFGPDDPDHPAGGDPWLASALAVEEANRSGGYRGLPFRLVAAWSDNPWSTGVARVARMAYEDDVWAIVGSIDGASTHLAEQIVAKARLTLIGAAATDKTVNLANVPWMFSCLPADDRQADLLAGAIRDEIGREPFMLISATDHDSRTLTAELRAALKRQEIAPLHHLEIEPGADDLEGLVGQVAAGEPQAVVILAGPADSARLVTALREGRIGARLFGSSSMDRRLFAERAGEAAEGAFFPRLCDRAASSDRFVETFESRFGRRPDCVTAQTYDATRLLIAAIRRAGLNRARIRDAVRALPPWSGAAGRVEWNPLGQNLREVRMATFSEGRAVPLDLPGP
jgi:ABC-type branched-subunit amino acid transport system substrate-binding protein